MPHGTVLSFLTGIAVLLAAARIVGTASRLLGLPQVVGEIIAGIVVGKTVLGRLWPDAYVWLFLPGSGSTSALGAVTLLAVVLLMFVAGFEVDLGTITRQGKAAVLTSLLSIIVPFGVGMSLIFFLPAEEVVSSTNKLALSLFLGVALSVSALPVIAKTLLDLRLFKSDLGLLIMASAMVDDVVGWAIFAIVLGMMTGKQADLGTIGLQVLMTAGFVLACLLLLRPAMDRLLLRLRRLDPQDEEGAILSTAVVCTFVAAALTEWMGAHAVFGAFLVGISVGASKHLRESTRTVAHRLVSHILAPIFFASMALRIDFIAAFEWRTVLLILLVACVGKILGAAAGAKLGGLSTRESWAVGFGMNARGAMEIILATVAMQAGVIGPEIFVALVVMAVVTSVMAGPAITWLLQRSRGDKPLALLLREHLYIPSMMSTNREGAIAELSRLAAVAVHLPSEQLAAAVLEREQLAPTAIGEGIAVPHARLAELHEAVLVVGRSLKGIDFDAPDGLPAHLVFLILTPEHDLTLQLQILSGIATAMSDQSRRDAALLTRSFTELQALMMSTKVESIAV
jgi:Kef-type K+ transport system membrane component KefB/mannitol/fructose-specific phosphotransferase system IIA component (Ntr-type)